eukprot:s1002_g30.t1
MGRRYRTSPSYAPERKRHTEKTIPESETVHVYLPMSFKVSDYTCTCCRCAPSSKEHGVLKILAVEAKLDRSVERAFLVLTLQRPRFRRLSTGWAQPADSGVGMPWNVCVAALAQAGPDFVWCAYRGSILGSTTGFEPSSLNYSHGVFSYIWYGCKKHVRLQSQLGTLQHSGSGFLHYSELVGVKALLYVLQICAVYAEQGENFQFDQEQRLSRELLRQILQLKRFTLFREELGIAGSWDAGKGHAKIGELLFVDIRDLVELTVGKMEMYHLVAALFMESSMALYFEGRIHHVAPPFILSLLYISIASAFMYLLLAVWLSMHASICSHSFGVRLLTRFVRLPVPGMQQMGVMNARLADFERQGLGVGVGLLLTEDLADLTPSVHDLGVQGMLRVPVIGGRQDWMQRQPLQGVPED